MLHTQINQINETQGYIYFQNFEHMRFLSFTRHPFGFMNSTKHVTHSTHSPAENESVLLNITKLFIRVLCSYCNCCLILSPSAPCVLLIFFFFFLMFESYKRLLSSPRVVDRLETAWPHPEIQGCSRRNSCDSWSLNGVNA